MSAEKWGKFKEGFDQNTVAMGEKLVFWKNIHPWDELLLFNTKYIPDLTFNSISQNTLKCFNSDHICIHPFSLRSIIIHTNKI